MRKHFIAVLILYLYTAPCTFSEEQATIQNITGKVTIQKPGKPWENAVPGTLVPSGTTISTGFNSTVTLDLGSAEIEIKPLTRMELTELIKRDTQVSTKLDLKVGKVRARIKTVEGITHDFELRSTVTVASVRGTGFEYDGRSLEVFEGKVTFYNSFGQKRTVRRGETSRSTGYDQPETGEDSRSEAYIVTIYTNENDEAAGGVTGGSADDVEYVDFTISVD